MDAYLALPADFAAADDVITNLVKEREPGDIERTPQSLIITSYSLIKVELKIGDTASLTHKSKTRTVHANVLTYIYS